MTKYCCISNTHKTKRNVNASILYVDFGDGIIDSPFVQRPPFHYFERVCVSCSMSDRVVMLYIYIMYRKLVHIQMLRSGCVSLYVCNRLGCCCCCCWCKFHIQTYEKICSHTELCRRLLEDEYLTNFKNLFICRMT